MNIDVPKQLIEVIKGSSLLKRQKNMLKNHFLTNLMFGRAREE